MVWVEAPVSADVLQQVLEPKGIRIFGGMEKEVRFVVHSGVRMKGCERLVAALEEFFRDRK